MKQKSSCYFLGRYGFFIENLSKNIGVNLQLVLLYFNRIIKNASLRRSPARSFENKNLNFLEISYFGRSPPQPF